MRAFYLFILVPAILCADAATQTVDWLESASQNLKTLRLQITRFDQDRSQEDASVDVTVNEDKEINAEAYITEEQAKGLLDILVADGFFDRAKEMDSEKWAPPPQPFYILWLRFGDSRGLYEFRTGNAAFVALLVKVRDSLAAGLAAKSVDRAVSVLDPGRRQWKDQQPLIETPRLPGGTSPLHPRYSFLPINNNWKPHESYLKPSHGSFIASAVADDTTTGRYKQWFRQITYSNGPDDRDCKIITQYPSGSIYSETDSYAYGVDLPRGDVYERIFREDGKLIFYTHSKDGQVMDAETFDDHGKSTNHVVKGIGFVLQPTFDSQISDATWYYKGLVLFQAHVEAGVVVRRLLNDNSEWGHAASLTILADGSETLFQDEAQWTVSEAGKVQREMLYRPDSEKPAEKELRLEYDAARKKFFDRFFARAASAGFPLTALQSSHFPN